MTKEGRSPPMTEVTGLRTLFSKECTLKTNEIYLCNDNRICSWMEVVRKEKKEAAIMNPVFWFLVFLAAVMLWLAISFIFIPLGGLLLKMVKRILNIINYEENDPETEEEENGRN